MKYIFRATLPRILRIYACLGTAFLMSASASAEPMIVTGISAGDSLNVRTGPSSSSHDIGDVLQGQVVEVIGTSANKKWSHIYYNGEKAWVYSRYLRPLTHEKAPAAIGANVVGGIAANDPDGGLRIRAGDSTSYDTIGILPNGTSVHVIQMSRNGKWAMISLSDTVGWVSTRYLSSMNSSPQPMPYPEPQLAPDGGALPAVFTVTNVAANDNLWVRQQPQSSAPRLGGLPVGSVINVISRASGKWVQISYNGQIGYVHSDYLTRTDETASSTLNGFPLGISCRGTEPFWTLSIAQDRSVQYTSLISGPDPLASLTQTTQLISGGDSFSFLAGPYSGALNIQTCSDGMSDINYTMAISLIRNNNGAQEQLYGCCNLD